MIFWYVCPEDGTAVHEAFDPGFLSASERGVYAGLRFPKRQQEWLLGRWTAKQLLRRSLDAYRSLPLRAISVGNDPDGAPYLAVEGEGRLPVCLSISHREGRAFCALSPAPAPPIGVDMERVEPRQAAFVEDFFTAAEAGRVWAAGPAIRDTLVAVIWSAKEAVLKAFREGLRVDTRGVEVACVWGLDPVPAGRAEPPVLPGEPTLRYVGRGPNRADWQHVRVSSALSGTKRIAAWWRREGDSVLTAAVLVS